MTSLPSGLASISSRLDDTPNVRGAVDMAKRLRRAEALSALAEMDAPVIDEERPADVARAVAFGRMMREGGSLQGAIDGHARLAVGRQGMSRAEAVARSMWAARVRWAAMQGIVLEPWGDGSIPEASGIMEEAEAALMTFHALALSLGYRSADRR